MSLSYEQTFLLDCSMINAKVKNDETWTNHINSLSLAPNDTISLYTAYINQIGSDGESIVIDGGDNDTLIKDSQTRLTIIPFLNNTANNNVSLPYNYTLSNLQRNMIVARDDQNKTITGFSQDLGQFMTGDDANSYYTTICYCNIANYEFTDPNDATKKYRFYDRFGTIQDGETTNLKTYLSSGTSSPNGDRHTGMVWNDTLKRYILKEITIDINIEPSSYSPSNLATLITDNLTLTEENIIENVEDEHGNKSGYFFESKTNFLDYALYTSINQLVINQDNQEGNNPVQVYPQMSPIITISTDKFSNGNHTRQILFSPKQDTYFSLGKNLNGNDGNCQAYKWAMGHQDGNDFVPSVVFFKYPFTQLYGGELNNNQVIDFNLDVKNYIADNNNPTPTIANYVSVRGDSDKYIITDLLATDENKLKVKKFFDAQLQEHNINDLYCYDFSSYVGNIGAINNRLLTKKGDEKKHRWINIGINNNFNTNTLEGGDTLGIGMLMLRRSTDGSLVYQSNTNATELMKFCCDYLGEDASNIGGLGTTDETFQNLNSQFRFNNWTQSQNDGRYSMGAEGVNGDADGMDNNKYGTFNSFFDVNCINTRYVPLPQLIKIDENKTYPNNDIDNNYGYFSIYTARDGRDYIMLEVDNTCGGFQTNVIEYSVGGQKTQNLFFNVGFSAYGNEAIMKCVGQGTQYDKSINMDADGNLTIQNYGKSVIQNSLGASEPTIAFSDQTSRFFISNAYEPCRITNGYGREDGTGANQGALSDGGTEVLLLNYSNFQKQRVKTGLRSYPYVKSITGAGNIFDNYFYATYNAFSYILPYKFSAVNHNTPFYYQEGGIFFYKFIENLSLNPPIEETEENFNSNSLFYKLGFRFNQFNITENNIDYLKRNTLTINQNGTINLQHRTSIPITNNSDLINTDNNTSLYVNRSNLGMFNNQGSNNVNQLQIASQSTIFLAQERPIKTTISYYLVCSDILQSNTYYSKEIVNCVDIVEKSINSDDFYYSSNSVVHTITRPYQIQNITHAIKKPDLTFLKNQNYSSVIYRITKNIITGYNPTQMENLQILQDNILKKLKKPKVKIPTKKQALLETLAQKRTNEEKGEPREQDEDDEEDEEDEERVDIGGDDDIPQNDIDDILEQIERQRQQRQQDNEDDFLDINEYYNEDDINRGDEML